MHYMSFRLKLNFVCRKKAHDAAHFLLVLSSFQNETTLPVAGFHRALFPPPLWMHMKLSPL